MKNKDVICDLGWSQEYKQLLKYGRSLINEERAKSINTDDRHVITHRLLDRYIPMWICDLFPIKPNVLQIFAIPPGEIGMTHKDGLSRKSAINIPLRGCALGYMNWIADNKLLDCLTLDSVYTQIRITKYEWENKNTRLIYTPDVISTLTAPSIINTDIWHRVDNSGNPDYRWVLSIRFEGNPSFNELTSILLDFNKRS